MAAREEEQGRVKKAGEKLLQLKSQRAQVELKLVEWEATFRRTHERDPAAVDRQRSSQHKELTKLARPQADSSFLLVPQLAAPAFWGRTLQAHGCAAYLGRAAEPPKARWGAAVRP